MILRRITKNPFTKFVPGWENFKTKEEKQKQKCLWGILQKLLLTNFFSQKCPWPSEWNLISSILTKSAANSSHLTWPNETKEKIQNHFSLISSFSSFVIKVRVNTQWVMVCTKWTLDTYWNRKVEAQSENLTQIESKTTFKKNLVVSKICVRQNTWHRLEAQNEHFTQIGSTKCELDTDWKKQTGLKNNQAVLKMCVRRNWKPVSTQYN